MPIIAALMNQMQNPMPQAMLPALTGPVEPLQGRGRLMQSIADWNRHQRIATDLLEGILNELSKCLHSLLSFKINQSAE